MTNRLNEIWRRWTWNLLCEIPMIANEADESTLGRLLMELVILLSARAQADANAVLKEAAEYYRVDTNAIVLKVTQEFAAKEKVRYERRSENRPHRGALAA
jgi:hypothetical protein